MTRRKDYLRAFWIDPDFVGLSGWPEKQEPEQQPRDPSEAIVVLRDRVGFEYQRVVGLDQFVSQREAAQLMGLPVMTINRWVHAKKLPSRKRRGFKIILLRDLLRLIKEQGRKLPMRGMLTIEG